MASNPGRSNGFDILNDIKDEGYTGVTVSDNDIGGQHITAFNDVGRTSWDTDTDGNVSDFHETINDDWTEG